MLKQDELSQAASCLNRAEMDEPIFVLRAHDPLAPGIVRAWAQLYELLHLTDGSALTPERKAKAKEAKVLAARMEIWAAEHAGHA